jgi:nicotinic acid phosphoribosyltransferase
VVFHPTKLQPVIYFRSPVANQMRNRSLFLSTVGACAHLTSFYGTDTISGCIMARNYYLAKEIAANSIPATEHSTMVSWTREKERDAYENILSK